MGVRLKIAIAMASVVLVTAACEGTNLFAGMGPGGGSSTGGNAGSGTVQGSVLANGSGEGNVTVILVGRDSTITDGNGIFVFDSIPAATYQITLRVPIGFALAAGQTANRSITVTDGGTTGTTFILTSTSLTP